MRELIIDLSLWIDYYCTCLAYAYNCLIKQLVLFYEITTVPCHLIVRKAFKELMTGVVPISKMCGSDNFQMDNRTYGYHRVWTNASEEDRNNFFSACCSFVFHFLSAGHTEPDRRIFSTYSSFSVIMSYILWISMTIWQNLVIFNNYLIRTT